jgi:hypothetical protein
MCRCRLAVVPCPSACIFYRRPASLSFGVIQFREKEGSKYGTAKTVIVTDTSQGIGAAIVQALLHRGHGFSPPPRLVPVDGDIGQVTSDDPGQRVEASDG